MTLDERKERLIEIVKDDSMRHTNLALFERLINDAVALSIRIPTIDRRTANITLTHCFSSELKCNFFIGISRMIMKFAITKMDFKGVFKR